MSIELVRENMYTQHYIEDVIWAAQELGNRIVAKHACSKM